MTDERIREIAERVAASYGLEVVEVELRGGGKARMLRITIDKVPATESAGESPASTQAEIGVTRAALSGVTHAALSGVTHEDCANVSREVSTILDVEDVVPGASYTLEVSSPGLDRRLVRARDWERFTGSRVKLMTREPVDGQKHFEGRLQSVHDGRATLDLKLAKKPTKAKKPKKKEEKAGDQDAKLVEIDLANVERANLVPEF